MRAITRWRTSVKAVTMILCTWKHASQDTSK